MRHRIPPDVLLLTTVLFWSFNFTVVKYALTHGWEPLSYSSVRFAIGAAMFSGVTYFREGDLEAEVVLVSREGAVPIVVVDRDEVGEEEAVRVEKLLKRVQSPLAFLLSRARPRRRTPVTFFESVFHMPAAYFLYALR